MSRCLYPFLVLSVPPPSLCHLWLHWLGDEGLASASLCLPMPCPASLPTCWGSCGQCCPPSLSINLLGKHSLERGGLSVCPSMMVLPMGSHPGTADCLVQCGLLGCFSSPGLIAWMAAVQAGSCLGRLRGLCCRSASGDWCWSSSCSFPPSLQSFCHFHRPCGQGRQDAGLGRHLCLPARAAINSISSLLFPSPMAPQHPGVWDLSQPCGFLGNQGSAERIGVVLHCLGDFQSCSITKGGE